MWLAGLLFASRTWEPVTAETCSPFPPRFHVSLSHSVADYVVWQWETRGLVALGWWMSTFSVAMEEFAGYSLSEGKTSSQLEKGAGDVVVLAWTAGSSAGMISALHRCVIHGILMR